MRKLTVFNSVSLDGFFTDANSDMAWAHENADDEWEAWTAQNAKGGGALVFGRKTYEIMLAYWPTAEARKQNPEVADGMNKLPKIVFSRTLKDVTWANTRLVKGDAEKQMRSLKDEPGPDLVLMGSGSLVAQLASTGLIDEYQIIVVPVVLGAGRTMFEGVKERTWLKLVKARPFANGNTVLTYVPQE